MGQFGKFVVRTLEPSRVVPRILPRLNTVVAASR
jgi:hypothetical protein